MSTKTKAPKVSVKVGGFACPQCGRAEWLSFMEDCSLLIGPAHVHIVPHAVSITILRRHGVRYDEVDPRLECRNCNHTISVDEIMPGAMVAIRFGEEHETRAW